MLTSCLGDHSVETSCLEDSHLMVGILVLWFLDFSVIFLSLRCRGCVIDVLLGSAHPTVNYFLHVDKLWLSLVVLIYFKKKRFTLNVL